MIAKFITALVSVFSGLTQGFANMFVDGADGLLIKTVTVGGTTTTELTTFAQFGIVVLGCGIVIGVVRWIAGRIGKIGR